jgi:hypothetical protein
MYSQGSDGGFVKKCASCSKDLPEAALHCVFCGAKQPPAPAVQPGLAKTAFGYSANEVMNQLGRQGGPPQQQAAPQYQPPTSTAPYSQRNQPASQPPPYGQPQQPQYNQGPQGYQQGGLAPQSNPHAATVALAPGGGPAPMQYATTQPAPYAPQAGAYQVPYQQPSGGMGINAPNPHTPPPLAPMPAQSPYYGGQQHAGPIPVEPWRYSLRMHMMIWGAVMLAVFAVPVTTDPMAFKWDGIGDMPSKLLIMTLLVPAIGLLAIVFGSSPIPTMMRGISSVVLGLAMVFTPIALLGAAPPWQFFVGLAAILTLIPGLLVRNEYTDSMAARILITIGVICTLLPLLVPENGELRLVGLFKTLIDAPGKGKVGPIIELGGLVLVVMSLLAWMPAPATGAAKIFAWAIILWSTLVKTLAMIVISPDIGAAFTKAPGHVVEWGVEAAVMVLIGYGGATVIGKQLE